MHTPPAYAMTTTNVMYVPCTDASSTLGTWRSDQPWGSAMPSRRKFLLGCLGAGAAIAAPVGWYGGVYEPNDIEVTRRTMAIRNLPPRLSGTTAVQISDFHLHEADETHALMIELIKKE